MNILNLAKEPWHINQLAEWHHNEWGYLNPNGSLEGRIKKMEMYLQPNLVPSTFIGKEGDELIGSAAIVESDMDTHKALTPWLANVYVSVPHRKKGYGGQLVKQVMQQAKEGGVKKLYLFTPSEKAFYLNLGWSVYSEENYRGIWVTIMHVTL